MFPLAPWATFEIFCETVNVHLYTVWLFQCRTCKMSGNLIRSQFHNCIFPSDQSVALTNCFCFFSSLLVLKLLWFGWLCTKTFITLIRRQLDFSKKVCFSSSAYATVTDVSTPNPYLKRWLQIIELKFVRCNSTNGAGKTRCTAKWRRQSR